MNLTRRRDDEEQDEIVEETTRGPCIQDLVTSSLKRFETSSIEIARPSSSSSATGGAETLADEKPKRSPHNARSTLVSRSS
jgi:hypothetical protein